MVIITPPTVFKDMKLFCRSIIHISYMCITPAIKFGHLLAKYFVLRIPFPWKRSVLSVQGWQMNWVHTVHTKVDPVYCHIDSFLLLFFLYMFVFYRYIFMVLVCLFCYFQFIHHLCIFGTVLLYLVCF